MNEVQTSNPEYELSPALRITARVTGALLSACAILEEIGGVEELSQHHTLAGEHFMEQGIVPTAAIGVFLIWKSFSKKNT